MTTNKYQNWTGSIQEDAVNLLISGGKVVVCPTKVGYIITATDKNGLERKFSAKNRKRNKPGVVLCGSLEQLYELADMTSKMAAVYEDCWNNDILFGSILPWKETGRKYIPKDGANKLMTDIRGTSCFVVKFGVPGEQIAQELWKKKRTLLFASSANPSGKGNRGLVSGIGERIEKEADLIICGDEYVAEIQPDKTIDNRYEQGVMVSFVDKEGILVPEQESSLSISPAPTVIRKGLSIDLIMMILSNHFNSWDYRQGEYY